MNNLQVSQIYTNHCDGLQVTCTIKALEGDRVTVHVSGSDATYTVHREIFEDTMRALGFSLQSDEPTLYRVFYINHLYYSDTSYEFINQAIAAGKQAGFEFRVDLGDMACCAWDPITGLRFFGEYQSWKMDQEKELARVEGSYD